MSHGAFTFCATIEHTQGASEYAFISFAAIVLRAQRELAAPLHVQIPLSLGGLRLDMLYTEQSLAALASRGGFKWLPSRLVCDAPDVIVSDHVAIRGDNRTLMGVAGNRGLKYTASHGSEFLQSTWATLRAAGTAKRRANTGVEESRRLRVSFALLAWTPGPLAHAHALLREETLDVLRLLEPDKGVTMRAGWDLPVSTWSTTALMRAMQAALDKQAACAFLYLRCQ